MVLTKYVVGGKSCCWFCEVGKAKGDEPLRWTEGRGEELNISSKGDLYVVSPWAWKPCNQKNCLCVTPIGVSTKRLGVDLSRNQEASVPSVGPHSFKIEVTNARLERMSMLGVSVVQETRIERFEG